ncbi:hypothetical protein GWY78_04125 [Salmonella enterica subsp. diarizonae]|nr:hypothetical protein [Salmonella enterica subsp. diarizonae]
MESTNKKSDWGFPVRFLLFSNVMQPYAVTVRLADQPQRVRQTVHTLNHMFQNITVILFRQLADILRLRIFPRIDAIHEKYPVIYARLLVTLIQMPMKNRQKAGKYGAKLDLLLIFFLGDIFISINTRKFLSKN